MSFVVTFPLGMTLLYTTQYTTNVCLKIFAFLKQRILCYLYEKLLKIQSSTFAFCLHCTSL